MNRRRLGRTGLMVSEISLGTVELGMDYGIRPVEGDGRPSYDEAARLLHRALDLGVNYIDTARAYGESETVIGQALEGRRGEYVLASKVSPGEPAKMRESIEQSLRALRTDVIDVMMLHSAPAGAVTQSEALGVLEEFRTRGHVRYIGASVYGEDAALAAIGSGLCDCLQIAYSAIDRRPESRVLPAAQQADVGIVVRSVLLKGALTHRFEHLSAELVSLKSAVRGMMEAASGGGTGLPEFAYRYVLGHAGAHTALVGTRHEEELEAAVRYAEAGALDAAVLERVNAVAPPEEKWLNPGNWPA
ncbi:MAG: aldo/keto reductase [Bryobacteraceae bacterium]